VLSWFALQVRTRTECQVQVLLHGKGYETVLPTYTDCRRYSDRVRKVQAAVFPGYVFCRFDATNRLPLLGTPGVIQIVSLGRGPAPIDEAEMEGLQRLVHSRADLRPWPWLTAGDRVRVEHGAFAGVEGVLVSTEGSDHLIISVTLLQRAASVNIDRVWVRPLENVPARHIAA
jgi:transcription termination/antitermination protein NusG